jgi:hypothetical protein
MDYKQRRLVKAARSRIWAIWVWYLVFNGAGAFFQAIISGEWAGFFSGWFAIVLLSLGGPNSNSSQAMAQKVLLASIVGATVQTIVVQEKRKALNISLPEEADELFFS